ncbi:uncharacterized protein ACA1_052190 [Acanthamoeba castellanii str. Neff]|uniref:G-patch domain-containing protein n=1 Tax=Acanthamoeba castellanii (strain ATCC 30010 / Neff) TaxID=1257118 RepID=L8H7T3_ACACF|nr:uncharacterized protein ACA1_052190 [Acanthamoeba castellanii str. Neff]ELR20531.1 hypothetical protein ACA1_052190 [Acanthamoeba castellanii str. Neff]
MIGALFGFVFYVVGLVVGLIYGSIGLVFYVVFGLAGFVLSWMDIYFCWYAALVMLYWVEYIDPWETKQRRDEVITFFPTIARLVNRGEAIAVTVHGWLYHPKRDTNLRRAIIAGLKRTMPAAGNAAETLMVESRLSAFIVDNRRGKRVSVQFMSSSDNPGVHTLSTLSSRNGHFEEELVIPRKQASLISYQQPSSHYPNARWVRFSSVLEDEQQTVFKGEALLLEDVGVSVISDIDDTIRISMVCDKRKLVLYSFLKQLRAVPGMAQLYRGWEAEFGARFHYVSGGPWQYYPSISEFFELSNFPKGTVHLRHLRVKDSSLFAFLKSPHFAKKRLIEPILKQFPKRKFIFVGDSGEKDPEIYAELAAQYPEQVKAIFIRRAPEHKAVTVVSKTTTTKEIDDKGQEVVAPPSSSEGENGSDDDVVKHSEEARMIAAGCAADDDDGGEEEDESNDNHKTAASGTGGRRQSVAYFRDTSVESSVDTNEMTLTKQEIGTDIDGRRTRTETRLVVEVSEEDRECLAEMSDERKAREWKRFAPIFAPLKGRTLCRVFTCPSEIADFSLDDIMHCRAYSGEDAVEWELVDSADSLLLEPPKPSATGDDQKKNENEGKSESDAKSEGAEVSIDEAATDVKQEESAAEEELAEAEQLVEEDDESRPNEEAEHTPEEESTEEVPVALEEAVEEEASTESTADEIVVEGGEASMDTFVPSNDWSYQLLQKMGWKAGSGLRRDGSGMEVEQIKLEEEEKEEEPTQLQEPAEEATGEPRHEEHHEAEADVEAQPSEAEAEADEVEPEHDAGGAAEAAAVAETVKPPEETSVEAEDEEVRHQTEEEEEDAEWEKIEGSEKQETHQDDEEGEPQADQ